MMSNPYQSFSVVVDADRCEMTREIELVAFGISVVKVARRSPSPTNTKTIRRVCDMATSTAGAATNKYAGLPDIVCLPHSSELTRTRTWSSRMCTRQQTSTTMCRQFPYLARPFDFADC